MSAAQHFRWLLSMAWRDSRRNRSRLLLFMFSVAAGIAVLVAIYSLGFNLNRQIEKQAASLLGADMEWIAGRPFGDDLRKLADSLSRERSEEHSFGSMVYFPESGGSRLAQIRALSGAFPYYGALETTPSGAAQSLGNGPHALVDQNLLLQYDANVGDSVRVGEVTFLITGALHSAPGQTGIVASVAPVVYIPLRFLPQTGLDQKGSRINYRFFFRLPGKADPEKLAEALKKRLGKDDITIRTVEDQKESTGRLFQRLTRFLGLAGFVALLLGCAGVASAVHIYIREKIGSIAILRCLGVKAAQAFRIFLLQVFFIGLTGSVIGAFAGTLLQQLLPSVVRDLLPFGFEPAVSGPAILQGIVLGVVASILFSLSALLGIRNISPLHVFRISYEDLPLRRDPLRWVVYLAILLFVVFFAYLQLGEWPSALAFSGGIVVSFLFLAGCAAGITRLIRHFFPAGWGYLARQGLANLFRPNNQTTLLIVSVGLGTMLITTLILTRGILLKQVGISTAGDRPNMVLFDVQEHQVSSLGKLLEANRLPLIQSVPIVNMRLEKVNAMEAAQAREDTSDNSRERLFSREYRVTYRDSLTSSEKVTSGTWQGTYDPASPVVPVSLEDGFATRNQLKLGDTLLFNVQGSPVQTVISSLREVDWRGIQTNFIVVFPKGILEPAPQFHVLLTRTPSLERSARFQQQVVSSFPNVSIVDLALVLDILDKITSKVGLVIRFMAGFSIFTGLIVLITSVIISKYQRIRESVLLRTLGATRKQVLVITGLEYLFLGAISAFTGTALALGASWALARFSFDTAFVPELLPLALIFVTVTALTTVIGLLNSYGLLSRPPLEILKEETR